MSWIGKTAVPTYTYKCDACGVRWDFAKLGEMNRFAEAHDWRCAGVSPDGPDD